MSLCDQIARQNAPNNVQPTGVSYFNGPQFQTIHHVSGRGQLPLTGEHVKAATTVVLQNPGTYFCEIYVYENDKIKYLECLRMTGYSFSTNPVCFYTGQSAQHFRMAQPLFSVQSPIMQSAGGKFSFPLYQILLAQNNEL